MENAKQRILEGYARDVIRHKAWQLIGKYGFTLDDYDDLQQEMMLDLLRRIGRYDPDKAGLNTFVSRIVDRKISNLIRHQRQEKRDYRLQVLPLDAQVEDQDGQPRGLDEIVSQDAYDSEVGRHDLPEAARSDLKIDISQALDELPAELLDLARRLQTRTVAEIARELAVPRSTLYEKGIARLRKIFEDKGLREYLGEARHPDSRQGK